jgi:hypothetical protein
LQLEDGVDLLVGEDERGDAGCAGGQVGGVYGVLGGVERDAGKLRAAQADLPGEVGEEVLACGSARRALADDADDVVQMVERDLVSEQDVLAVAGLGEEECGAPADDLDAVLEKARMAASSGSSLGWPLCTARKIMEKDSCIWVCLCSWLSTIWCSRRA